MNKETSLYLDAVRFIAAILVFIDHASSGRYTGGFLWQLAPLGPQAVMVFFVLSGFVIGYVSEKKEDSIRLYTISRVSRIYSVALPALILTFVLDEVGRNISPALYSSVWGYEWNGRLSQFLHAMVFENQTWYNNINIGSDLPYWSLGYEIWYYVLFGVILFSRGNIRILLFLLGALIVGPKILALLPIWFLGFLAYKLCTKCDLGMSWGLFVFITSTCIWVLYELYVVKYGEPLSHIRLLDSRLIYQDYIVGFLFFLQVIGFYFSASCFSSLLSYLERPIRWLAGGTFSLYLFHMPLCQFVTALSLWSAGAWESRALIFFMVPIMVYCLAHFTERKKASWRRAAEMVFDASSKLSNRAIRW